VLGAADNLGLLVAEAGLGLASMAGPAGPCASVAVFQTQGCDGRQRPGGCSTPLKAASYAPINGTYNGLFFQTNGAWEQSAGLIAITTTSRGAYSAKVQVGADHYSHSGALSAEGEAAFQVARRYGDWLHVAFQVDPADTDVIAGTVSNSTWVAAFYADRAVFDGRVNVCTNAGRYTLILPGDPSSTNSPGGDSYGTVNLSTSGRLTFSGFLADGHRVSQSATVSKEGRWPLFIPLYSGYGALYSWHLFNDSTNGAISGTVAWEKPALSWEWFYPAGFSLRVPVLASHYAHPPRATAVLDFSRAWLAFNGGELDQSITNNVLLTTDNRLVDMDSSWLRFSFSLSTGTFSGRYRDYNTWTEIDFSGVVLQDHNVAAGCFPGWDQSGEVWLQSQ